MKVWLPDDLMKKLGALDHLFFSNGLIRFHCTLSNSVLGPKFYLRNFRCHASWKKNIFVHCFFYISKIVWWLPLFDFGIFCHLLRLMGIYWMGGPHPGIWKVLFCHFFLPFLSFSFSFVFLFFSSFSFFIVSLGGPLSFGAPEHCPPMPPSRYATDYTKNSRGYVRTFTYDSPSYQ